MAVGALTHGFWVAPPLRKSGQRGPRRRGGLPRLVATAAPDDNPGPLVEVSWLQGNLEEVRIFDARGVVRSVVGNGAAASGSAAAGGGAREGGLRLRPSREDCTGCYDDYLEGHIPGAVFVSWVRDGVEWLPRRAVPHQAEHSEQEGGGWALAVAVEPDVYAPCFEARGLSAEQPVVVYDDGSLTAARVWWQLLLYGHPAPYILQGGWSAWLAAAGKAELYEPCPLKLSTVFEAEMQPHYRASLEELLAAAREEPGAAGRGGGAATVAVLVETEAEAEAATHGGGSLAAPSGGAGATGLPHARRLRLSALLGAASSPPPGVRAPGGGPILAAAARMPPSHLAEALSGALGVAVGPGSGTRLVLASGDVALSACCLGVLLQAAGHRRWAVCDTW